MKRVAVCVPSYNEILNIRSLTEKVDSALSSFVNDFDFVIINADNNSPDGTARAFMETKTACKKISIISREIGKGYNVKNFIDFCMRDGINYVIMLDADLKSFKEDWIKKMLNSLLDGYDFVCPLYQRSRFEGNTTNHFIYPLLTAMFNINIRQPIGGDYAFNRSFMQLFQESQFSDYIYKYGIDIFLLLLGIKHNLNIQQVNLGSKVHAPSYMKMKNIFINVAHAFQDSVNLLKLQDDYKISQKYFYDDIFNTIPNKDKCLFWEEAEKCYQHQNMNFDQAKEQWLQALCLYIKRKTTDFDAMADYFIDYVFSFWQQSCGMLAEDCEKIINELGILLKKRLYEIKD